MEYATNQITLRGSLSSLPEFSHENHGRRFFRFMLEVPRLSGAIDTLPVIAEEGKPGLQSKSSKRARPGYHIGLV